MYTFLVELRNPLGATVEPSLEVTTLDITLKEGAAGVLVLELPNIYPEDYFIRDSQIRVYWTIFGRPPTLLEGAVWFVRKRVVSLNTTGVDSIYVEAYHANVLLERRYLIAAEGTAGANKTGTFDNIMKALVRENFVSAADTARNWGASLFAVASDLSLAPSTRRQFDSRTIYELLANLRDECLDAGTYIGFEVRDIAGTLTFLTYIQQRGADRRASTPARLIFGRKYQNVSSVVVTDDWVEESSFVYAFGPGEYTYRPSSTTSNASGIAASQYGRIELAVVEQNDSFSVDGSTLSALAAATLSQATAKQRAEAAVIQTLGARFGIDYSWGDLVTLDTGNRTIDCRVDPVQISLRFGETAISVQLTGEA